MRKEVHFFNIDGKYKILITLLIQKKKIIIIKKNEK